jgi:hypothetical protein
MLPGYISPGLQWNESVMLSASVRLLRADRIRYRGGGVNESHAREKFKSLRMASEIRKKYLPIGYHSEIFLLYSCVVWVISYSEFFYLLIVDVEVYFCPWSHTMTHIHTHSVRPPARRIGPLHRPKPDKISQENNLSFK